MSLANQTDNEYNIVDIVIGSVYIGSSLIDLIPCIPCLIVIKRDRELKKHSCFKLMFHLGIVDMLNIMGQAYAGIITLAHWGNRVPKIIDKVMAILMFAQWETYLLLLHVIAINRFVHICLKGYARRVLFSDNMVKMWMVVSLLYGLMWSAFIHSLTTFRYIPAYYTWFYEDGSSTWVINLAWFADLSMVTSCMFYYILIVSYFRFKVQVSTDQAQARIRAKERLILRQAAVLCIYTFMINVYWNLAPYFSQFGFAYAYALGNWVWILNSGINPLVYLTMNKTISMKVKKMIGVKNRVKPSQGTNPRQMVAHKRHQSTNHLKDHELKKHSCFKLMFQLGITDMMNIVGQSYAGIITMAGWGNKVPRMISRVIASSMLVSWKTYLNLLHMIALNRFVLICLKTRAKNRVFSDGMVKMWIGLCWLGGLLWAALIQPFTTPGYIPAFYTWYYEYGSEAWVINLSWLYDIIMVSMSMVYYVLILVYLRFKVEVSTDDVQSRMREKEKRILRQAVVFGLYTYMVNNYWNLAPYLQGYGFAYAYALGNLIWISNSGINPLVYLTMNKTISKKVKRMIGLTNEVVPSQGQGTNPQQRSSRNRNQSTNNR